MLDKEYRVIKRGGHQQIFDVKKIRKVIEWAVQGLDANSLELESKVQMTLRDGITTREIQDILIFSALKLTSIEQPDWKYVAGRLKLFDLYSDMAIDRGHGKSCLTVYDNYLDFVKQSVEVGKYDSVLFEKYNDDEIKEASTFLNKEYDVVYDYAGMSLIIQRYLLDHNDRIWELPQEMFLKIAFLIYLLTFC